MDIKIKQRIELIKNGQVPQGYKKTKVGIVPEDWDVKSLIYLCIGKGTYGINAPGCDYNENLPLYLRITDIDDFGKYTKENRVCVNDKESYKFYLKENDLLFARTGATTGKTYLYNKDDGDLVFAGFLIKFSINNKIANSYIISQYCKMSRYWNWVNMISTRSGQPGINAEEYSKLKLPYIKNLKEQQKIADILTTQDKLIELKQKLIEEKEKQKKYLMQNLLTGKIRLKGFNDKWEKARLKDLTKINNGGTPKTSILEYFNGNIYWASIKDLTNCNKFLYNTEKTITKLGLENSSAKIYPINSILFSMYACIGEICICKVPCSSSQAILGITCNDKLNYEFLYYYFLNLKPKIKLQGQCGTQNNLNKIIVSNLQFLLPPLEEQNKIAEILSKADEEIELLKRDLEQEKDKKKALMQLLLTGIVRV